jgi:four helix bundle protein
MLRTIASSLVFLPFFFSSFILLVSSFSAVPVNLKVRTRDFALRMVRLYSSLPKSVEAQVIGKQVLRSGTSVGANYREGLRARSRSEYGTKLNISLMELEETLYWLELLEAAVLHNNEVNSLKSEIGELCAILVTLIKRAKS